MDTAFDKVFTRPENKIFQVVFFPDRVYHARYLNATRSDRYRYNVTEVRAQSGVLAMKGEVYLDGRFLTNFLRLEYEAGRLSEMAREKNRLLDTHLIAWIKLLPDDAALTAEATVKLVYCPWVKSYQTEIWDTLEPPATVRHDFKVLDMMGRDGPITRVRQFSPALQDLKKLGQIALALRENDIQTPIGYAIADPEWDNDFMRSHQEPRTQEPSSAANTISDRNYLLDFQRAYFVDATKIEPVRYRNAMMDPENPDMSDDNVLEMRWLIQREFGSSVVFFHEVTIPAGKVEGTHWHIGTEELYYVTSGQGIVYMGEGDDPTTSEYPTVSRHVYGVGFKDCKEIPVRAGHMLFTKSGGIHGIRNTGAAPLKFVAFLYHSS